MLLWLDSFDNFGTSTGSAPSPAGVIERKYSGIVYFESIMDIETGRLGGYCLNLPWNSINYPRCQPLALTTNSTLIIGLAVKVLTPGVADRFLNFAHSTNRGVNLRYITGELAIYDRSGAQLEITSGLGWTSGTWKYVECKIVCDVSGSYTVKVDGVIKLSGSAVDTRPAVGQDYNSSFQLQASQASAGNVHIDDLYCCDGSGTANNDFLGNVRVEAIRPDAAGDSTQLTPSAGNNYECVDEEVCDDDTTYVESVTIGQKDLYGTDAAISETIFGVQANTDCRETDASSFDIKTLCKSGGNESADVGQAIGGTDYVTKTRILETDPADSNPWTASGINAAQFGLEVA